MSTVRLTTTRAPAYRQPPSRPAGPASRSRRAAGPLAAVVVSVTLGLAFALVLWSQPLPLALALAAGAGLMGALALALAGERTAVLVSFALLGVVVVEPAPCDGLLFVIMAVAAARGRIDLKRVPPAALGLVGALLVVDLVSAIDVVDAGRAASFFAITLYLAILGMWLPGWASSRQHTRTLLRGYLFAACVSAALGLAALYLPVPGKDILVEDSRAKALFQDPNVFGPFLVPAALIVLEELVRPRLLRMRVATKALILLLLIAGVVLSYSRGAWINLALGIVVMLAVFAARSGGARTAARLIALLLIAAAGTSAVIVATGSVDFLVERARPQAYDTNRFSGQRAGIEAGLEHPFGLGPGQFERQAGISAHSTYARVIGEQGIPGMVVLFGLLLYTLCAGIANCVAGRDTYGLGSAALLGSWCGVLVNSFVIDTLHWRHLWILAALIWAGQMRAGRGRYATAASPLPRRGWAPGPSEYEGRP